MKRSLERIEISKSQYYHLFSLLALVGSGCWFGNDMSWEPGLSFLATLGVYVVALKNVLETQFEFGRASGISKIAEDNCSDKALASVSSSLLSLIESEPKHTSNLELVLKGAYGLLFKKLRLLAMQNGKLEPVSERAELFLKMLAMSANSNVTILGEWKAEGSQNTMAKDLGEILLKIENFRITECGGIRGTPAVRTVSSSLILLKAKGMNEPVFLMRWSDAWGGYYWFVGGIQEGSDGTPEKCAERELKEELGLLKIHIQHLTCLKTANDKRISSRLCILTEYSYNLFVIAVDESYQEVQALLQSEFDFPTFKSGHRLSQRCKWLKWSEIKSSPELNRDAGEIIRTLDDYGVDRIPLSVQAVIH